MLIIINTRILYQFYILIKNLNTFVFDHTLYYIVKQNIFVVNVYKYSVQKKY